MKIINLRILIQSLVVLMFTGSLQSQDEPGRVTKTIALENVHVVTRPGTILKNANVVIKDGLITRVGKGISIPLDAEKIKADTMYVYAGFIDGLSHIGVPQPKADANPPKVKDPGNPTNERAGVTPDKKVIDHLSPKDKSINDYRKVGFTAAHVVPHGGMLAGQGAVILLDGKESKDLIFKESKTTYGQLKGAGGVFPNTIIAVLTKYKELYKQAQQASSHISKYQLSSVGMKRPTYDEATMAMIPVTKKQSTVFFKAPKHLDIHRVLQLQKECEFKMTLTGLKGGYRLADKIKAKNVPVLLSLDLPKEEKGDDKKSEKKTESEWDNTIADLKKKKTEAVKQAEMQAATFEKKGIAFGFTTEGTTSSKVLSSVKRMIKAGLSERAALAALTTNAAQILGVSQSMGTVESGKIANLVISAGPIFEEKSEISYVCVEGVMHKYEKKKAKSKKSDSEVSEKNKAYVGTWEFTIDAGQMQLKGEIEIVEDEGVLKGTLSGAELQSPVEIDEITVEDNVLSFNAVADGENITWTGKMENDGMTGSVVAGSLGTFPITATRTSGPE